MGKNEIKKKIEIKSIDEILNLNMVIPNYQRPYKWDIKNIDELLNDIKTAIANKETFKYRLGTIILHHLTEETVINDKKYEYAVVDGQQRLISLALLGLCINEKMESSLLGNEFKNKETIYNINRNHKYISEWYALQRNDNSDEGKEINEKLKKAFSETLEAVVIIVDNVSEAFQLFDCQNNRGKALVPHDLLKAYHLRAMRPAQKSDADKEAVAAESGADVYAKMKSVVTEWEAVNTKEIKDLYEKYLFPIYNWSMEKKSHDFSIDDIDVYKGIESDTGYTYAIRLARLLSDEKNCFQITEPIISGEAFFKMTAHYLGLLREIDNKIWNEDGFEIIKNILSENTSENTGTVSLHKRELSWKGLEKPRDLFYCAALYYYDKFGKLNDTAIKKLFAWAFMLRLDMVSLGFPSVNLYAIGEQNKSYTNQIAVFSKIKNARKDNEISRLQIGIKINNRNEGNKKLEELHRQLASLLGQQV